MKFETYAHEKITDQQIFFRKDPCVCMFTHRLRAFVFGSLQIKIWCEVLECVRFGDIRLLAIPVQVLFKHMHPGSKV